MARVKLSNKRKAGTLSPVETSPAEDNTGKESVTASSEPPKKSRKTATPKTNKILPKTEALALGATVEYAAAGDHGLSTKREAQTPETTNANSPDTSDLATNNGPKISLPKTSRSKKAETSKQNALKSTSAEGAALPNASISPQDSVVDEEKPSKEKPKKSSTKAKKSPPRSKPNKNAKRKKMPEEEEVVTRTPSPPRPAPINQAVANKVRQVLQFVNSEDEDDSNLFHDPENRNLISVPWSSLVTAVMKMASHWQIEWSFLQCIRGIESVIVRRFERAIGKNNNVDWVTIDASQTSHFENTIQQKIAHHGLEEINLLEIELEMFTKRLLENTDLFIPATEDQIARDRYLWAVASVSEEDDKEDESAANETEIEEDGKKSTDSDRSRTLSAGEEAEEEAGDGVEKSGQSELNETDNMTPGEEEVGKIGVCPATMKEV